MYSQRTLPALVLGLAAACAASAQSQGGIQWRGPGHAALGLQAGGTDFRVPCGSIALPCDGDAAVVPLYGNRLATRSLDMQVGHLEAPRRLFFKDTTQPQGLAISLVGKAGLAQDLGIYGRLGATMGRDPALAGHLPGTEGTGLSYGVGLSWDFSPRGSAILGWDSYDFRTVAGERDVRAASVGLQWRY